MSNYKPTFTKYAVIFDLKKPIFHSTFGIWQKWLDMAGKRRIVVNTPFGIATFGSAKEYKHKAKLNKRYYKNPDEPMRFWCMSFKPEIDARIERKKAEKEPEITQEDYKTSLKVHLAAMKAALHK